MRIRCPHRHNGIELVDAAPLLVDIECPSCGSHFSLISGKSTTDAYGPTGQQTIAHFRLIRMLGTGAFGCVWLADDQQLDCQVAIKIPRLEKLDASKAGGRDWQRTVVHPLELKKMRGLAPFVRRRSEAPVWELIWSAGKKFVDSLPNSAS